MVGNLSKITVHSCKCVDEYDTFNNAFFSYNAS